MKKTIFIAILVALSVVSTAQINQITSVSGYLTFSGSDANKYYTYMPTGNKIYIYNWDGSLYKMVTVTPPSGYSLQTVYCLSKKCINNDDKLEMCVSFISSSIDNNYSKMWLINEDGTKLNDFGNAFSISANYSSYNGETHLNVMKTMTNPTSYSTIIYRCSGSGTVKVTQPNDNNVGLAYPNPATNYITIPYQLKNITTSQINIYDASGRMYSTIPVGAHFNEVKIDVSDYPAGLYIYECEGMTSSFMVQ